MSSKSKSALPETPKSKASPATPRGGSKLSRGTNKFDADSPLLSLRSSFEKSPRSVTTPKTSSGDRHSTKLATPPDKKPSRLLKPSELQTELSLVQEDLKKAKEKIESAEKEKTQALDDLKEAKKLAEEANEKLREALIAQKRAEDNSEIDKFRAVEMEQAGIEAAQKKEEEWLKDIEAVRKQQASDASSLLSTAQELEQVKQELAMATDAKNQALTHADDATKVAEIHAEKVEILSAELARVRSIIDSQSELHLEIDSLREELERRKKYEVDVMEKEGLLEKLRVDLEAAKIAESCAHGLLEECKKRVDELEIEAEEAHRTKSSALEYLGSAMKQVEDRNELLHKAESEISSLKEKIGLLEFSIDRQKEELRESDCQLKMAREEASVLVKKVESLSSDLETVRDKKIRALSNEKLAAESVGKLLEEKNRLFGELESLREEEEKSKRAIESLTSALHEVSSQVREANEKLLSSQVESGDYEIQIEDLKVALQATNDKYENMLGDAKQKIDQLTKNIEQSKEDYQKLKAEREENECNLMKCVTETKEANSSMEKEISRLVNLLKDSQEDASIATESKGRLETSLCETKREVNHLREVLGEAKAEGTRLKESLIEKETEVQNILQESEELRIRETMALKKIEEMSLMLEETLAKKQAGENGKITDTEKDTDKLLKIEQNGLAEECSKIELLPHQCEQFVKEEVQETNDAAKEETNGGEQLEVKGENGSVEDAELKMQESCKFEEKDSSPERDDACKDESEPKEEVHEKCEQPNGLKSSMEKLDSGNANPVKQQSPKRKKPLLSKFGSFIKKKGTVTQK
ncbi:unnamed protein product [Cuscuta campestris]|uniref:WEB family protein n=1 Tax=Cuscuta campestris TaxID=132261 RepID=A0A484KHZ0_9ASTE|nr:unnamed protein product [Cuscuta campestris]